ncbi:hypothetical protein PInf_002394 [Phytophthora infestans]|nr:hypothetical protein PInf_002394 [Phytophthora infestans]
MVSSSVSSTRVPSSATASSRPTGQSTALISAYLLKQSAGKWNRKRWNQRWFVLDRDSGLLRYFRHASPLETVPLRQDAHGVVSLKQGGVSLVVQGDLPSGVPTPFCFTILVEGQRELRICADTNAEFRQWTATISTVISPMRASPSVSEAKVALPSSVASRTSSTSSAVEEPSLLQSSVVEMEEKTLETAGKGKDNVQLGPNYRKTKLKAASAAALLELVAVDVYRSDVKADNVGSIVDLSALKPESGKLDLFIVNCQVPSYQPSNPLWGEKQGDGPGFNFVTYFAIPPAVREMLDAPGESSLQAVRSERFKAIGIVVNPQEQNLGRAERRLLETYNGQPILTRPQHRFYHGDGYFEVDVDAHDFNYIARKGLVGVSTHACNMILDFGFVLEGQEDNELPEQILGCVRLCKVDLRQAPWLS